MSYRVHCSCCVKCFATAAAVVKDGLYKDTDMEHNGCNKALFRTANVKPRVDLQKQNRSKQRWSPMQRSQRFPHALCYWKRFKIKEETIKVSFQRRLGDVPNTAGVKSSASAVSGASFKVNSNKPHCMKPSSHHPADMRKHNRARHGLRTPEEKSTGP